MAASDIVEFETTKEAIEYILADTGKSKYALAKSLGKTPPMVDHYLTGTMASPDVAKKIERLYYVRILTTRAVGRPV